MLLATKSSGIERRWEPDIEFILSDGILARIWQLPRFSDENEDVDEILDFDLSKGKLYAICPLDCSALQSM